MQKHIIEDRLKWSASVVQHIVLDKNSVVTAEQKRISPLVSDDTIAFDGVFKANTQYLRNRILANKTITNKQLSKPAISCPNIVLNAFSLTKPDVLPLAVAMFSQIYTETELYADNLNKTLRKFGSEHEKSLTLLQNNPAAKNYFFLPYSLVRTLLNFDSITDDYEPTKFERAVQDIRVMTFPLIYNRNTKKQGEQLELLTSLIGNDVMPVVSNENLMAFENVFYWLDSSTKDEYLCFTISPEFRNLLMLVIEYACKQNEKFSKLLPFSKIDWHFLHYLPNRNNLRQMYLFIRANMINFSKIKYVSQHFEYSTDELRSLMQIDKSSHYFNNDSHFVRDKIRKVIDELMDVPGFEYKIEVTTRNIKTPGGRKEKRVKFTVGLARTFEDSLRHSINYIQSLGLTGFNNDSLLLSCLRYCWSDVLNRHIKASHEKFLGLMKIQSKKDQKEYTDFSADSQICRFISSELTKFWQDLASKMFIVNQHSKHSREINNVLYPDDESDESNESKVGKKKEKDHKITSSSPVLALQKRKRGRPRKNVETSPLDGYKLSGDELNVLKNLEDQIQKNREEEIAVQENENTEQVNETVEQMVQSDEPGYLDAVDIVIDQVIVEDVAQPAPSNFNGVPISFNNENIWEGFVEDDLIPSNSEIGTFSITTENLKSFLEPVNAKTDHYAFVDDYLEHIANPDNSETQQVFYNIFSLTNILNMCEHGNPDLKNRSLANLDLYKEKLNIVLQTLNTCFGTSVQRNDQTSYHTFALELALKHFMSNLTAIANGERIFSQKFFVQLADTVITEKKLSPLTALRLSGQCVAYPFS